MQDNINACSNFCNDVILLRYTLILLKKSITIVLAAATVYIKATAAIGVGALFCM